MSMTSATEVATLRRQVAGDIMLVAERVIESALQPIVEAATGAVFGYESLMRGHDAVGCESPLDFLDIAERNGKLLALEQMTTTRALSKFATLPHHPNATLFLNLDVRLIPQGILLVDSMLRELQRLNLDPSSVCFEFSERFDNSSFPEFATLVFRMRRAGFKLAIDDFGVGHGEMKLLCDHAVDYLKIDRHFIADLDSNIRKRYLVKNIVTMAHVLGTRVIAEGIETEGEFVACREFGVDLVQGWFVAHPTTETAELKAVFPHLRRSEAAGFVKYSPDDALVRRQIEVLPAVFENDSIDTVFELFRRNPRQSYFPVLNASREPRGVINEYNLKSYIYQPFGRDLLKNKAYERTISHFVEPAPVIGIDATASDLMRVFAAAEGSNCVIVMEDMRYAGVVSASSLIKMMNETQLKVAQDQNPLTSLPGNHAILDFIYGACRSGAEPRFFCYCDFDYFKPFNDAYGFHLGDHVISLFAALMRRYFFIERHFLGHVGGDDFFIGVVGWTAEELREMIERMRRDFQDDVLQFYTAEDRSSGHIHGHDRNGAAAVFPLVRCSIGVLELPAGLVIDDLSKVGSAIADIKAKAKEATSGLVFHRLGETN